MIGEQGQHRLARSTAIIVGCGALGCVSADLLARAGVGTLILIDRDIVETTNLQRQTLYTEADAEARLPKAEAARRRLAQVNAAITIHAHIADLAHANAEQLSTLRATPTSLDEHPIVLIDATDNFPTRFLLNDLAVKHGLPFLYAGGIATQGTLATILPKHPARDWDGTNPTACLRCLIPEPPPPGSVPTCDTAGVLGPLTSTIASLQAAEAIKCLLADWPSIARTLHSIDLWTNRQTNTPIDSDAINPECPCCGARSFTYLAGEHAPPNAALCGRNAVQVRPSKRIALDLAALADQLRPSVPVHATPFMLRTSVPASPDEPPIELTVFADGRAIVEGTSDLARAQAIYARLIGH